MVSKALPLYAWAGRGLNDHVTTVNHNTDAELLEMIERADSDHDGEINFEEFFSIMTRKTFT